MTNRRRFVSAAFAVLAFFAVAVGAAAFSIPAAKAGPMAETLIATK